MAANISAVITPEERIDCKDIPFSEVQEFVSSMTTGQIKELSKFFSELPALKHTAKFNCEKCGVDNELELKGLSDFF
jgi:hypothetical protein